MIFVITEDLSKIEQVELQSFVALDVSETKHIEEWVRRHPRILGEDLLIVSKQFEWFEGSSVRPDLIAVDREGNLVVVELKRDKLAGHADLQAVRYAAMLSTMTLERLLPYYVDYHKKTTGEDISKEELRIKVDEFVETEDFEELSDRPRTILCSEDFSQEITTTVLWLRSFDLDISCVRITPHQLEDKIVLVSEKIIPLKESEQYLTGIQEKEEQRQESKKQEDPAVVKVREVLEGLISDEPGLQLDSSGKNMIRMAVDDWDTPVLLQGSGWGKSGRILMFEFKNSLAGLRLTMYIGLGPQETRQKLFNMAHAHPEIFTVDQTLWNKWNMILSHEWLSQEMYDDATVSERENEIREQWAKFLKEHLPRIDAVLKKEQWIWQVGEVTEASLDTQE